jgi:hypothetical protein
MNFRERRFSEVQSRVFVHDERRLRPVPSEDALRWRADHDRPLVGLEQEQVVSTPRPRLHYFRRSTPISETLRQTEGKALQVNLAELDVA